MVLRQEIEGELAAADFAWSPSVWNRLKILDSVIIESQPMSAPGLRECSNPPNQPSQTLDTDVYLVDRRLQPEDHEAVDPL